MPQSLKKIDFSKMRTIVLFGLVVILGIGMLYVFQPFFYPIFWAAIIAIFFYPWYEFILHHLKSRQLSSILTIGLVLIVIFLPLTLICVLLYRQSMELYFSVSRCLYLKSVEEFTELFSRTPLAPYISSIPTDWTSYATDATKALSIFLFNNISNITQNIVVFLFDCFIMIYTLYYFFKDGPHFLERLRHISPLGDNYEVLLYERFTSAARATLKGTFIISGIQGLIAGILFAFTGVSGAIIWAVILALFSAIPALGAFVIWLPIGIITIATGHIAQGLIIIAVGTFVISIIDNILRPPMVGKDIQMHPLLILFSTLGGVVIFGISGFVIGPIIAALFLAVISIYDYYYQQELENN